MAHTLIYYRLVLYGRKVFSFYLKIDIDYIDSFCLLSLSQDGFHK